MKWPFSFYNLILHPIQQQLFIIIQFNFQIHRLSTHCGDGTERLGE